MKELLIEQNHFLNCDIDKYIYKKYKVDILISKTGNYEIKNNKIYKTNKNIMNTKIYNTFIKNINAYENEYYKEYEITNWIPPDHIKIKKEIIILKESYVELHKTIYDDKYVKWKFKTNYSFDEHNIKEEICKILELIKS